MKILVLLLLPLVMFAQQITYTAGVVVYKEIQITLDSTATADIYMLYKTAGGGGGAWYLSETAPTGGEGQTQNMRYVGKGALAISIVPVYITAEESDSLYATVQSYNWKKALAGYYPSNNDIFYLVFDTFGTYTQAAIDYLDWANNTMYTADLSGIIMPSNGLKITFGQVTSDQAGADVRITVGFHLLR